jgi:hypothetical protein
MNIIKESKKHLAENNMGYCKHLQFASGHGLRCIKAGLLLILHSIIPALYPRTGSKLVNVLNKSFTNHNEWLELKHKMEIFKNIYKSD